MFHAPSFSRFGRGGHNLCFALVLLGSILRSVKADPPFDFQAPKQCPDLPPNTDEPTCGRRPDVHLNMTSVERAELAGLLKEYLTLDVIEKHVDEGQHGNNKFFSWHREYIKGVEDFLEEKNKTEYVPLPKWNPANPIPKEFCGIDPDCPKPNCTKLINLDPKFSLLASLKYAGMDTGLCDVYGSLEELRTGEEGSWIGCNGPTFVGNVGLEPWHGCVHVNVGGTMGLISYSPGAVIFMLWHAFVDDVVRCWQCDCKENLGSDCSLDIAIPDDDRGCLEQLESVVSELPRYYNLPDTPFMIKVKRAMKQRDRGDDKAVKRTLKTIQKQAQGLMKNDRYNRYPYHLVQQKAGRCMNDTRPVDTEPDRNSDNRGKALRHSG